MNNSRGGSDRLGFGRLKIPESVKGTIQDIREITGKQHNDEDIYSVLRECFMDPNETAQKLLYLDTFHEVKRKSERRKVASSTQGRGQRGSRGYHSGNSTVQPRENRVNHTKERGHVTLFRAGQRKNNGVLSATNLHNGTSGRGLGSDSSTGVVVDAAGENLDSTNVGDTTSSVASDFVVNQIQDQGKSSKLDNPLPTSASDIVMISSNAWHTGLVSSLKREVERKSAEQYHGDMHGYGNLESGLNGNEQILSTVVNSVGKEDPGSVASMQSHLSDSVEARSLSACVESLDISSVEEMLAPPIDFSLEDVKPESGALLVAQSAVNNGHVTFPDHLKVPEALKSGLVFGSFNDNGSDAATPVTEENRTVMNPLSSEKDAQLDNSDQSESPKQLSEKLQESGTNVDAEMNRLNQEITLLPDGQVNCTVPIAPNQGFEIVPVAESGQLVQLEGQESKAHNASHLSSFVGDNFTIPPQTTPVQNPVTAAPQPLHFRPPYHPNFLPYGHYYNPYFLPPFHQFLSPNGLPQQPSTGNAYLAPATIASGVKFPLPQLKPGTNKVNPSLYGSYGLSPAGFNPGPTMNLGGTANNDDVSTSQMKESQIYTNSSMSETSAWIPQGHEMSSLPLNSFYNLPPQGQHLGFPPVQTGHSPFLGIYPSVQTATALPTSNQILQHSQPLSASAETVGPPPSAAFQQPQLAQMSWNSSY